MHIGLNIEDVCDGKILKECLHSFITKIGFTYWSKSEGHIRTVYTCKVYEAFIAYKIKGMTNSAF